MFRELWKPSTSPSRGVPRVRNPVILLLERAELYNLNPFYTMKKLLFLLGAALMFCHSTNQASAQSYASVTLTGGIQELTIPSTPGSYVVIAVPGPNWYYVRSSNPSDLLINGTQLLGQPLRIGYVDPPLSSGKVYYTVEITTTEPPYNYPLVTTLKVTVDASIPAAL